MIENLHFISGLPRSGSTLLCALLKQNPRFTAAMTSPVASLFAALLPKMSGASEFSVFFNDQNRAAILKGVFEAYYADRAPGALVFDTNRIWTARAALLGRLYPGSRIICCVRDIAWIIDSLERMLRKNPLQMSRIFNFQPGASIYSRVETLMNSENGLIGLPWSSLREAWFSDDANRLIVVDYDRFTKAPEATLHRLYRELGQEWFDHDFDRVQYDEPDFDAHLGMPGLHTVRQKVEPAAREVSIPPDLVKKYSGSSFWANPNLNPKGVLIL